MPTPLPPPVAELERRLGLPEGTLDAASGDLPRATAALEDATDLALSLVGEHVASAWQSDAPRVVRVVVLKAARREFENPRGLSTESIADRSVGITQTSGVYLTPSEQALIAAVANGRQAYRVGSLRTPSPFADE